MNASRNGARSVEARTGMVPVAVMSCLSCFVAIAFSLHAALSAGGTLLAARLPDMNVEPSVSFLDRDAIPRGVASATAPGGTRISTAPGTGLRAIPLRSGSDAAPGVASPVAAAKGAEAERPAATEEAPSGEDVFDAVPRLKPVRRSAGTPVVKPVAMGGPGLAPDEPLAFVSAADMSGGTASLFADYSAVRERVLEERGYRSLLMPNGGSILKLLEAERLEGSDVAGALAALSRETDLRRLEPGTAIEIAVEPSAVTVFEVAAGAPADRLTRVRLYPEPGKEVVAWSSAEGWQVRKADLAVETRYATAASVIEDSLFGAGSRAEVPQEVMIRLANLFLYDVDFQRDIRRGDRFEVVYEVHHDEKGRPVGTGDIVFAALSWRGGKERRGFYRFEEEGEPGYFDAAGRSVRRLLMKTPIEGARVTSGFGRRRHPISGYTRRHKGVDFGARSGTPIMAAGDGTVAIAGPRGTFGNYIQIEHANGYETAYAHLKGFARGLRAGQRVRQGDVIGYVGSTGASTGPHLHYEVHRRGQALNPMALDIAGGRVLDGEALDAFEKGRRLADTLRSRPFAVAMATEG